MSWIVAVVDHDAYFGQLDPPGTICSPVLTLYITFGIHSGGQSSILFRRQEVISFISVK